MLKKNQAEKRRKNRRKNVDSEELNEMDNKISMIIAEMKNVAAVNRFFFKLIYDLNFSCTINK